MREKFIELECKTPEEGLQKGVEFYEVDKTRLKLEILESGKKGIFGSKPFKVRISLLEEMAPPPPPPQKTIDRMIEQAEFKSEDVEGDCGTYTFEVNGIYLSVFNKEKNGHPVEIVEVYEEINELGFTLVDDQALAEAIRQPGKKVLIAPPQPKKMSLKKSLKVEPSYLTYTFKPDGIYMEYHPPFGQELSFTSVYDDLTKKGVKELDLEAIKFATSMKNEEVKIAPAPHGEILKDGRVEVNILEDEMQASITVYPPFGGKEVNKERLIKEISAAGIKIGINDDMLNEALIASENSKVTFKILGKRPKTGKDTFFEYLFNIEKEKEGPQELEDGRVDYRELGLIENITRGTILVRKIPPTLGEAGLTVKGEEFPPLMGKDIPLPVGKGTHISENGLELLADIDGCPVIVKEKVVVDPVYTVPGNVDFKTGNIEFVGAVMIRGNVTSGFTVKAGGDVNILGNVEEAIVEAGGKINIIGGAYGRGKTFISAGQDVMVKFVENVTIKSKANVKIGEASMHSNITAGKKIIISGKKGLMVGGKATAVEEVKAKTIGNHMATPTEIEVGVNPELREELRNLEKKMEIDQDNLNKAQNAVEALKNLQKQQGDLLPAKKELLLKLTRTQFQLMAQIKAAVEKKAQLEEAAKENIAAKVSAADKMYPGVKITIKQATLLISDEIKFVTLFEKNGEVKVGTYR